MPMNRMRVPNRARELLTDNDLRQCLLPQLAQLRMFVADPR